MSSDNMTQETATSQTTESASTAPETTTTTSQATTSSDAREGMESSASAGQAPPVPTYTPNYKFKAYEKEYELDELYRPLIKDADTEAKIKALHSKAYALDPMKDKLEGTRREFDGFRSTSEPKLRAYDQFNKILENKDWDTFFKKLNVPNEEIFAYVEKQLALMNAPAEQKAEYDRNLQIRQQAYMQEEQLKNYENMHREQAVQTRHMHLDSLMSRPEVQKYAGSWDERAGQIGAFRQLVIDEATAHWYQTGGPQGGEDWAPEQAVQHVINKYGKVVAGFAGQTPQTYGTQQPVGQQNNGAPPVIPHVAGRGTSPIKKVPKSLDDIKKLVSELRD